MNTNADLLKSLKIDRQAPSPPSRRGLWIGLGVAAAILLLVVAGWLVFARGKAIEVQVAPATAIGGGSGGAASVLDATGYVVARRMATVSAKITGRVREVRIEEGQHVAEGEIIATLDPIDADQQLALARAQAAAARSQVDAAAAQLRDAEANAARLSALAPQQLVSKAQRDQAIAQRDNLRAQLASVRNNARAADDSLRIAEQGVDNTIIRAPFAGVVIAKAAQPGEIVSPFSAGGAYTRTGIGTIVDMDSLEVQVDVGEAYIGRVQPGMPTEATLNAYPDWKIPGKVIAIIPTADRGKATVTVRVGLDVRDPRIVPDMGVRVSFLEKAAPKQPRQKPGVLVPGAAIVQREGGEVAFVVDGERVRKHALQLGRTLGDDREVLSGLAAGDQVVLDPPEQLADGAKVKIAPAGDADNDSTNE
jgi:RND family efflux transporter MFP subunit